MCGEIGLLHDIAEAWKHRRLSRRGIRTAGTNTPMLEVTLSDGTVVSMADVFERMAAYLEREV